MEILRRYGLGPNPARLLGYYWEKQSIVPKSGKFLGWTFGTVQGITEGSPVLTIIFNIAVDTVVQEVLAEVFRPHQGYHELGWASGESNLVLYADAVCITDRDTYWVQYALSVIVDILNRVGLEIKLEKTKVMVCTPDFIWGHIREEAYNQIDMREGEMFRERKWTRVSCLECGA